jgi:hypothetical protein
MKHPMVFARLNDAETAFEPERNLIHAAYGLDGGGAVAADNAGDVYVFWHAPAPGTEGEGNRRIWVARSNDDGKTFAREQPAYDQPTGACGCCAMSAFADHNNNVYALYRSATGVVHRDIYLLYSHDRGATFHGTNIAQWKIGVCTMSMEALSESATGVLAAWETMGNVYYGVINPSTGRMSAPIAAPGEAKGRKYPSVTGNSHSETLLLKPAEYSGAVCPRKSSIVAGVCVWAPPYYAGFSSLDRYRGPNEDSVLVRRNQAATLSPTAATSWSRAAVTDW